MYEGKSIAVVVPADREEKLIGETIRTVPGWVDHVFVVDDASPDHTGSEARAAADTRTEVIAHEVNQGVGGAIVTGHRRAIECGADICVVMAGDGQMDPRYLESLLEPVVRDGFGYAKGNRFFAADSFDGMPRHRLVGNLILTLLTKAASGYWSLVDPQNGYTAVTADVLRRLPLHRLSKRYEFENDILVWLNILDVRVAEVAIPARYGDEESTLRLRSTAPRLLWVLFHGFWRRMWRKHVLWSFSPIALLLFVGLSLVAFGVVVGVWAIAHTIGPATASAGTVILAVAPFVTGIHMLIQALALDIQATPK
jgi:glycosyltransferase involved in cell wall biosynthesis